MRRFYFCSSDGLTCLRSETLKDDMLVKTNVGMVRADALQGSTKASLTIVGAQDSSGDVTYTAVHGGTGANTFFVEHEVGETGPEFPHRQLAVTLDPDDEDGARFVVTFGTTGGGFTITPTAQQVADLISNDPIVSEHLIAAPGGTGDVGVSDPTYLTGGKDDGDWRKFNVRGGNCLRINTVEVV